MSHRIRLRAGWTRLDGLRQTKVHLPDGSPALNADSTDAASPAASVRYLRPFNCPSGLDIGTRVDLVIESWQGLLQARLDDVPLAGALACDAAPLRVEVTPLLHGHHQLLIELTASDDQPARMTGIAFLEINP